MAHFAQINTQGVVEQVIVIDNTHAPDPFPQSEALGQQYIKDLGLAGDWLQTSYNANFRKNYAGIGYTYDQQLDAFVPPQPFDSWTLDTQSASWIPPVAYPTEPGDWIWDETTLTWIHI